ncbi:peroxidase family protein [Leisingera sp. M658]|uniref:peroxidase family protein n=1 Tax=Leisingera sp. M658 TaxID=2867015 RepID=UPI0021A8D0A5|nr:peroxidase family protein [Leisingera sp. M658]UWQ73951.1 peroxidase [Leisingera sp. M658]
MSSLQIGAARPADGYAAHSENPTWGATGTGLLHLAPSGLTSDGGMAGADRPNPREISNILSAQDGSTANAAGASDFLWIWGQFLDHDLSLTGAESETGADIEVPAGDPFFDPFGTGDAVIPFTRVAQQDGEYLNEITAFIDASMIYGSTVETVAAMRDEGGRLRMTKDGYLDRDGDGFLTGDVRAAENVALSSMHTVFTREHNRLVGELAARDPDLTDDQLFEAARARVEALVQSVTFKEFLPLLIGQDALGAYQGYDPDVNPGIAIEFSTAVFRLGHTLLPANLQLVAADGTAGLLALRDAFFQPHLLKEPDMIENVMRGAATQASEAVDTMVVEDVRSFLFGPPGAGGLDLAALNIQRGRDLGVASYNDLREALGLGRAENFSDITQDAGLAARLEEAYGETDLVDAWVGGLAEDPTGGGLLGETFTTVMVDQFTRLRSGDPFWSEGREGIPTSELKALWDTNLSEIILRNTDIGAIQKDIFTAMDRAAGTIGDDTLEGGAGRDFLFGSDGADSLAGRAGGDDLQGGRGKDTLAGNQGDDCLDGGAGRDRLNGGFGEDFIFGGTGKDNITGGQDNDSLSGGRGMDRLSGNKGNDTLDGGLHADTLTGGTGDDLLTGGAGGDCFLFRTRHHGDDTITDFELGLDEIKVTGPMRHSLSIEDTEGGLKFSDGANWSVLLEDISMGDWFQSGDSLF